MFFKEAGKLDASGEVPPAPFLLMLSFAAILDLCAFAPIAGWGVCQSADSSKRSFRWSICEPVTNEKSLPLTAMADKLLDQENFYAKSKFFFF